MTTAIQACCSESRRSRYGAQPRSRSLIDTSAASAVSGTVKPASRNPLGVSTSTRRRRCDIKPPSRAVASTGHARRRLKINLRVKWSRRRSESRATTGYVGRAETFPRPGQLSHLKSQPNLSAPPEPPSNVRFRGKSGHHKRAFMSAFDPKRTSYHRCCCSPATYVRGAFFLSFRAYIHRASTLWSRISAP